MPAASGGKRSMKMTHSKIYEGSSASQQCRVAERSGALSYNAANQSSPSNAKQALSPSNYTSPWVPPATDYNKPWFEHRDGEWYCTLCNAWAVESHVRSDKHWRRADNAVRYGYYNTGGAVVPAATSYTEVEYDKPWFEPRPGGEYYCTLCNAVATEAHVASDKHKRREVHSEYYLYANGSGSTGRSPGTPGSTWSKHWSEEHQRHYYHNSASNETQWEEPPEFEQLVPVAPQSQTNGAAVTTLCLRTPMSWAGIDYNKPWFEQKEGEWYCNLCGNWATDGHVNSDKHRKREEYPEWYGYGQAGGGQQPAAAVTVQATTTSAAAAAPAARAYDGNPLPTPWTAHWNEDHNRWYYYNPETQQSTWDEPQPLALTSSPATHHQLPAADEGQVEEC